MATNNSPLMRAIRIVLIGLIALGLFFVLFAGLIGPTEDRANGIRAAGVILDVIFGACLGLSYVSRVF